MAVVDVVAFCATGAAAHIGGQLSCTEDAAGACGEGEVRLALDHASEVDIEFRTVVIETAVVDAKSGGAALVEDVGTKVDVASDVLRLRMLAASCAPGRDVDVEGLLLPTPCDTIEAEVGVNVGGGAGCDVGRSDVG